MRNRKSKICKKTNLLFISFSLFCLFWLFRSRCDAQQTSPSETVGQNYLQWVDCEKHPKKHLKKPIEFEIEIEKIYTDLQSGYCLGFDGILMEDDGPNEQHKISTHFHPWNQFLVNGKKMTFNDATSNEGMKPGAIVIVKGKFKGIDKNGAVGIELEKISASNYQENPPQSNVGNIAENPADPAITEEEIKSSNRYDYENELDNLRTKPKTKIGKVVLWEVYITSIDSNGNVYAVLSTDTTMTNTIKLQGDLSSGFKKDEAVFVKGKFAGLGHKTISASGYVSQLNYIALDVLALRRLY